MQITRAIICYYTPIGMAKIKNGNTTKCWWGCGETGSLICCWWECKMVQPLWKTVWQFLKKLQMRLPYNLEIALLGTNPREMKTYFHTKICTQMFIAPLLVIIKKGKQFKCPSTGKWLNCGACMECTMEYYSGIKRNELLIQATTWKNLQRICCGKNPVQKLIYCMIPFI